MVLRATADDEQQFTMRAMVDTHRRFMDLSVVYTNDPVWVEHSITTKKYTSVTIRVCHSRSRFLSCMYIHDDFMTESR